MKKIKVLTSIALIGSMLLAMTGCGTKVNYIEKKEFKKLLKNELDMEEDEDFYVYNYNEYDRISAYYGDVTIRAAWYDDEDDAYDEFEDMYDEVADGIEDGDFKGDSKLDIQDTTGYIMVNGKMDGDYAYGGIYFCDNMIVQVSTESKRDRAIEGVNEVLDVLGLPSL